MKPQNLSIPFELDGRKYNCEVIPIHKNWPSSQHTYEVILNDVYFGIITYTGNSWASDSRKNNLVEKIGSLINEMQVVNESE